MENTQAGLEIVPAGEINWMECFAHKSLQCDQILSICAREAEVRKKLYSLYAKWLEESMNQNTFAPDDEVDKRARGRTGACAEQLRKILHGEASTKET